ncbi:MAG: threonine--tRNA ligase [Candidatus Kerfeldbacteria bacterium]|nr:threonine--tRNA ligase [Candidatus Kerfeldbacteria bacterium]
MAPNIANKQESVKHIRHTLAHLLASAVLEKFPQAKLALGPTIEHGFYYDIDIGRPVTPEDLPPLEKRMKQLVKQGLEMRQVPIGDQATDTYLATQPFKQELMDELRGKGETITFYRIGNFTDLCRGGHVKNTREINNESFALTHAAGAYWRGDAKKPMLQRIYGVAFGTKAELDHYLTQQTEAANRDHRKIGKELDLFSFQDVAPGAPFWHPNGMIIVRQLEQFWREMHDAAGYWETSTPIMNTAELYKTSGHWEHFRQDIFTLKVDDHDTALKPMNCPSSTKIYASRLRSYRDLPLRLSEIGRLHRHELHGALGGLLRVRQITMDDAHIYCRPDQVQKEIEGVLSLIKSFYKLFGLVPSFKLATMPDHHLGEEKTWRGAEKSLQEALRKAKLVYETKEKDGAFYGPKIDVHIDDALGRTWQVATIQLDFQMPERFQLEYHDEDGQVKRPVMIHRAIFGSFERFLGILIEHTGGHFPLWLSPVQVQIIPVATKHNVIGKKLWMLLHEAGIRAHVDDANETVGYKIRKAEKLKAPFMVVVGDKEKSLTKLTIRVQGKKAPVNVTLKHWIPLLQKNIARRSGKI